MPPKFKSTEEVRRDWIAANFSGRILDNAAHENHQAEAYAPIPLCRSKAWTAQNEAAEELTGLAIELFRVKISPETI